MKTPKKISLLIVSILLVFSSCLKDGFEVTSSGLHYLFYKTNEGPKPKIGDILQLDLEYKNQKDSILYSSKSLGDSFLLELKAPSFTGGLEEGLAMMSVGDSAAFLVSADSVFDKMFKAELPAGIKKGEILRFEIKLKKIMNKKEMIELLQIKQFESQKVELKAIDTYLKENQLNIQSTKPGVYFIQFVEGKGVYPEKGDIVEVNYVAKSLRGAIYDSNAASGHPLKFTIGQGDYLPDWVSAIKSMKKGGRSRLILTSQNAYKGEGFGPIPGNTPIVFEIELVSINGK